MSCVRMGPTYFVVVLLPSRQIKRVAMLTAYNYPMCIKYTCERVKRFCEVMFWMSDRPMSPKITNSDRVDKSIKNERVKRFNRFKDQTL